MAKQLTNKEETLQILGEASQFARVILAASGHRDSEETIRLCKEFGVWGKHVTARLEAMV